MMAFHRIKDPERLHALIDAILLIEADANLTTLLKSIVESATSLVGARYGALGVLASDGTSLASFITHASTTASARRSANCRAAGRARRDDPPRPSLRVEDLATHPGRSGFPANHPPMKQFLGVPVIVEDGTVFGNLYLTDHLSASPSAPRTRTSWRDSVAPPDS